MSRENVERAEESPSCFIIFNPMFGRRSGLLLVSHCCLYFSLELRGDLPNPMLPCVFRGFLQHFLFGVPPYYMCASVRWINLGALNDFPHGSSSLLSQDLPISENCCENLVK